MARSSRHTVIVQNTWCESRLLVAPRLPSVRLVCNSENTVKLRNPGTNRHLLISIRVTETKLIVVPQAGPSSAESSLRPAASINGILPAVPGRQGAGVMPGRSSSRIPEPCPAIPFLLQGHATRFCTLDRARLKSRHRQQPNSSDRQAVPGLCELLQRRSRESAMKDAWGGSVRAGSGI